jgi:hypothetical protein
MSSESMKDFLTFLREIYSKKLILPVKILLQSFQEDLDNIQHFPELDHSSIPFEGNYEDVLERLFMKAKVYSMNFIQNYIKNQNEEKNFREYKKNQDIINFNQRVQTLQKFKEKLSETIPHFNEKYEHLSEKYKEKIEKELEEIQIQQELFFLEKEKNRKIYQEINPLQFRNQRTGGYKKFFQENLEFSFRLPRNSCSCSQTVVIEVENCNLILKEYSN